MHKRKRKPKKKPLALSSVVKLPVGQLFWGRWEKRDDPDDVRLDGPCRVLGIDEVGTGRWELRFLDESGFLGECDIEIDAEPHEEILKLGLDSSGMDRNSANWSGQGRLCFFELE